MDLVEFKKAVCECFCTNMKRNAGCGKCEVHRLAQDNPMTDIFAERRKKKK